MTEPEHLPRKRVAILISGRGSNMSALIDAAKQTGFPADICLVFSNKPEALGLATARSHGISAIGLSHLQFSDRDAFDRAMHAELIAHHIEFICLAGFMRLLSPWFCTEWVGRMINVHPALLPSYKGLNTHARALADGAKIHGCTIHHVTAEMDVGPIIAQAAVPVLPNDTAASLGARVLAQEHGLYPVALAKLLGRAEADAAIQTDALRVI